MTLSIILLLFGWPSLAEPRATPPITAAAIAPDGDAVLLGSQSGIELRSWPELAAMGRLPTELTHVHDLRFSPDGRQLLAVGGTPAEQVLANYGRGATANGRSTRRSATMLLIAPIGPWMENGG